MDRSSPPRRTRPPGNDRSAPSRQRRGWRAVAAGLSLLPVLAIASPPEARGQGEDAEIPDRLRQDLRQRTGADGYLGIAAAVAVGDRVVFHGAVGHADLHATQPLREDAIFRIYSMTKPVTSVAALMLVEDGRLRLDDPVARHLPAFARLQRVAGGTPDAPHLLPVARPLTVRHLLTHTAGFATGGDDIPVASALLQQQAPEAAADLAGYADRVARAPLADEPGTRFRYDGVNTEVLARVIEAASGQPFERFVRVRILQPLGMRDTGFEVPAPQRGRVMALTSRDASGRRVPADTPSARRPGVRLRAYASGAGGLYSTVADYLRFARMLAGGGVLDGVRLLREDSVRAMMRDQLAGFDPPVPAPAPGEGFGLGGYVVTDPRKSARAGSAGQFGWSGAASTYFTLDPARRVVIVLMSQHLPADGAPPLPKLADPFYRQVHSAVSP